MSDVRAAGEALVADNRARLEAIFADALAWLESRGNAEALARLRRRARGLGVGL
jgi:predicted aminopeptidase